MLNASPLMHGVGKGLSTLADVPARATAKESGGTDPEFAACGTVIANYTMPEESAIADMHGAEAM